jgi:hypothetical protein
VERAAGIDGSDVERTNAASEEGTAMRGLLVLLGAWLALVTVHPSPTVAQDATPAAEPAGTDAAVGLARTDTRYFLPFTRDGLNPGLTVTGNEQGNCQVTSSVVLARPDAWDCIGENDQIYYDPCFENPFAERDDPGELVCIASPFTTDVVLLALTDPLVRQKEAADSASRGSVLTGTTAAMDLTAPWVLPWALELGNGERCTLLPGTVDVVAGMPIHYGCDNGGAILGEPDRGQPVWAVSYLAEGDVATTLVDVAVAWS